MSYTRFSFEKQFTKLMLKYVLYSLFLGSTAAASLSGTGKEIPSNASAYHVFKKLLSPLKDKKKKVSIKKKNEDANVSFFGHIIRVQNLFILVKKYSISEFF